jgi:hypothetical protein
MAAQKPLVIISGQIQQLPTGDTLAAAASNPESIIMTNANVGAIVIGTPVYVSADSSVDKANASGVSTAHVLGLVVEATIATTNPATIQTGGVFTATAPQWNAVAETAIGTPATTGLTPGSVYFLSSTVGKISSVAPTGAAALVAVVGVALSTLELEIDTNRAGVLLN